MNIYEKLNNARAEFHQLKLKKTGHNKFAGYYYFELGDFLVPALEVFRKHGLCAIVSFADCAKMSIYETEGDGVIAITSPMGSASLKGCHDVQNIGAVETYQRRYLWVAALEIVEHDALDAVMGAPEQAPRKAVAKAPVAHDSIQAEFECVDTLQGLKSLWDGLSKEERAGWADAKDKAKARIERGGE